MPFSSGLGGMLTGGCGAGRKNDSRELSPGMNEITLTKTAFVRLLDDVAAQIALLMPSTVMVHLIFGVETAALDQALGQAESH